MEQKCNELRAEILKIEKEARVLLNDERFYRPDVSDAVAANKEMIANIMLSVRHLEDARMRLGKVIQAKNDGVSCYDRKLNIEKPPKGGSGVPA